jgi:hypothetical protein
VTESPDEQRLIQHHAMNEIKAANEMLVRIIARGVVHYDEVNDAAELLRTAAWRLKP